jgi:hypothetical protein
MPEHDLPVQAGNLQVKYQSWKSIKGRCYDEIHRIRSSAGGGVWNFCIGRRNSWIDTGKLRRQEIAGVWKKPAVSF